MKIREISKGNVCTRQPSRLENSESPNASARRANRCLLMAAVLSVLLLSAVPLESVAQAPRKMFAPIVARAKARDMNASGAVVFKSNTPFVLSLYRQLRAQARSLIFAPDSISNACAMVHGGAHGKTASETTDVLHFSLSPKQLLPVMAKLLAEGNEKNPDYQLNMANALLAQESRNFLPVYRKLVEENYAGGLRQVNFQLSPELARTTNQWIEKQTNNKIQTLLPSGAVDFQTRLVLSLSPPLQVEAESATAY